MAVIALQPWLLLFILLCISLSILTSCQSIFSQNIETFYPSHLETPSPAPSPGPLNTPPPNSSASPPPRQSFSPSPLPSLPGQNPSSSDKTVVKAIAATAASTFVLATLLFFLVQKMVIARRRNREGDGENPNGGGAVEGNDQGERINGSLKGLIVDENGLDVLYWRNLDGKSKRKSRKDSLKGIGETSGRGSSKKHEPVQEMPLLRGKSSTSDNQVVPESETHDVSDGTRAPVADTQPATVRNAIRAIEEKNLRIQPSNPSPSPPPPPPPPPPPQLPQPPLMAVPKKEGPAAPAASAPPPAPPVPAKRNAGPPPPKLPARKGTPSGGEGTSGTGNGQVKLKPLHWDKVNKNTDHSMVWDKIDKGSFR